ncbi:MAG: hypothetical protein DYG93_08705 [Leptolyngbya sp. PLA2]|nr:hypothetical protein [Leptolyngbya sp.]MCE7971725.1 hypothetical protein [Leptolyngbya sp. PL-A2]MDL1904836.1 hypothetical protein [Synechococcales cyanobacterium CNB]
MDNVSSTRYSKNMLRLALVTMVLTITRDALAQAAPDELRSWLKERIATRGAVHFVADSDGSDHVRMSGYDAATGAWYHASGGRVWGVDANGVMFANTRRNGRVQRWEGSPREVHDTLVERTFPDLTLRFIEANAEHATKIERARDGGWSVTFRFPLGNRQMFDWNPGGDFVPDRKPLVYHINGEGRLTAVEFAATGNTYAYEYVEDDTLPFGVVRRYGKNWGWTPSDIRLAGPNPADEFSMSAVVERAERAGALDHGVRWSVASTSNTSNVSPANTGSEDAAASRRPAPPFPEAPRRSSFDWPLIGVGVVFVAVGIYAWVRRR